MFGDIVVSIGNFFSDLFTGRLFTNDHNKLFANNPTPKYLDNENSILIDGTNMRIDSAKHVKPGFGKEGIYTGVSGLEYHVRPDQMEKLYKIVDKNAGPTNLSPSKK